MSIRIVHYRINISDAMNVVAIIVFNCRLALQGNMVALCRPMGEV